MLLSLFKCLTAYRPRTLQFTRGFVEKIIEITWLDQKYESFVKFNRIGTYDGDPPNWPEWARMNKNPS
ncbi:hypothetical protein ACE1CA_32600 [Aerosakkonemataceae cyanobacterium BLCC-F167]|uniref:Uncharacterized protein n=1 Tax=Floridaenema evergladense BLCC-F167 TaxID=3153639 RepID=A0ABV4WVZ2_9CYAN